MFTSRYALKVGRALPFLLLALICSLAWGQSNVGEISGQVSDATGAAVPGCAVTATHTQTGLKRTVVTQDNGIFVFRRSAGRQIQRRRPEAGLPRPPNRPASCSMPPRGAASISEWRWAP